MHVFFNATRPN